MAGIYSLYDEVKNVYLTTEVFQNDRDCRRTMVSRYVNGVLDRVPDLKDYPNQFNVVKLADFNEFNGEISNCGIHHLLNFSTCVNEQGEKTLIDV